MECFGKDILNLYYDINITHCDPGFVKNILF